MRQPGKLSGSNKLKLGLLEKAERQLVHGHDT